MFTFCPANTGWANMFTFYFYKKNSLLSRGGPRGGKTWGTRRFVVSLRVGHPPFLAWAEDPRGRKGALPLERMRKRSRAGHSGVYSFVIEQAKWKSWFMSI
jgi:hypothetical protein